MPVSVENPDEWIDPATPLDAIKPLDLNEYRVRAINPAVNYVPEKDIEKSKRLEPLDRRCAYDDLILSEERFEPLPVITPPFPVACPQP